MNDLDPHDKSLNRLLAHLNTVEPEQGFERRVLQTVSARTAAKRPTSTRVRPWSFAAACSIATLVALTVSLQLVHSRAAAKPKTQTLSPVLVGHQESGSTNIPVPKAHYGAPVAQQSRRRSTAAEPDPTQLASFPAPTAPLTEQEKLLLQVAHSNDPKQLAVLVPEKRAAAQAAEEDAYLKFFPPPSPLPPSPETLEQPQ